MRLNPCSSLLVSRAPRSGVTLIELLIVILIISILASLVLGVAMVAGETAREQHSRHVVERLHTLMTDYYNTYKTKRVRLNPGVEKAIKDKFGGGAKVGAALAEARLYAQREMILMDIPDRWSDVILEGVEDFSSSALPLQPVYLIGRTDLSNIYYRQFMQLMGRTNSLSGVMNTLDEIKRNQGAECLYMFIMNATGDGEARTLFGENCIGDSDGDERTRIHRWLEAPRINFLRWAPGFDSQIQLNAYTLNNNPSTALTEISKDRDPFDVFRVDPEAYRLVPLIYSPGRDETSGINVASDYVMWRKSTNPQINNNQPFLSPRLTPYLLKPTNDLDAFLGTSIHDLDPSEDETSKDNIHNHLLGKR